MAILNGMYIHVTSESVGREVQATSHPVEQGIPTTDMVKAKALSINLSGKIVDYGDMKADQVISQLKKWQESGTLLLYQGRNVASNMQIRSLDTDHPYTNNGGADFSLMLEQVRIAKSAYVPKKNTEKKTAIKKNVAITVGAKVIFKGGSVYVSSDAKKAATTRGRSTCKVTKISEKSWSVYKYHLISMDGGKVYGWVNKASIEGVMPTITSGTTNAGTQQVKSGTGTKVYHVVKKGDTVWTLVNTTYKHLGKSVDWVIKNNPNAFTRSGDATTLKINARLLMGYK